MRKRLFQLAFLIWTIGVALVSLPVLAFPERAAFALQRWWVRGVFGLLHRIMGVRYEIAGRDRLPRGAVLIASKHQSAWDTMVFFLIMQPPPAFFFKRELLRLPIYGWLCLKTGMVPVDRKGGARAMRATIDGARKRLGEGRSLVIFPEGTRVLPGERRRYQPGVAGIYRHLNVPVVPVALNSGLFWPKAGLTGARGVIRLEFLEPIPPGLDKPEFLQRLSAAIEPATDRLLARTET